MHRGSIGILDGYGMRGYLTDLLAKGFDVKIVGHSLGAGALNVIFLHSHSYPTLAFTLALTLTLTLIRVPDP